MRETLFRGRRMDNFEFVYGYYTKGFFHEKDPLLDLIYVFSKADTGNEFDYYVVDPDTVGEFSGIKDRAKKMIFEGDIVRAAFVSNNSIHNFHCVFRKGSFVFDNGYTVVPASELKDIHVVGNVYGNCLSDFDVDVHKVDDFCDSIGVNPGFYKRFVGKWETTDSRKCGLKIDLVSASEVKHNIFKIPLVPYDMLKTFQVCIPVSEILKMYRDSILNAIENTPSTKIQPLGHAQWLRRNGKDDEVYCSKCGTIEKSRDANYKSRRCPFCGVDMYGR